MNKLNQKIFLTYRMTLLTGLRVGDSKEKVQIGGVDAPVVRRKDNFAPYVPGSSIKGKIRCLLELMAGENAESDSKNTGSLICHLFGASENRDAKLPSRQSRLIVRDADLTEDSRKKLEKSEYNDLPYTEIKWENNINRLTGVAGAPRQFERVPAGAEFEVQFVINVFDEDKDLPFEHLLKKGIEALEDDYLGGSGSRGYGRVQMTLVSEKKKQRSQYLEGTGIE